jgi:tRNA splicing endonuclease
MTQYDNNNTGALFKNMKKTSEKDADYSGESEIDHQKYMVWARIKKSKTGVTYMSLSYALKTGGTVQNKTVAVTVDVDDNIPF